MRGRPRALLEWFQTSAVHQNGALSPNATPVSLLAASYVRGLPLSASVPLRPFIEETLHRLRAGRWWLGYDQRLLHDKELCITIESTGGKTSTDPVLAKLRTVEQALRRLATVQRGSPIRIAVEHGQESILVIARPRGEDEWHGTALAGQDLSGFIESAIAPIRTTFSYPLALVSSNGRLGWGDPLAAIGPRSYPLRSVSAWELRTVEPAAAGAVRQRRLWYALLALLLAMLTFGLVLTTRVVRREMELARLKTEFAAGITHEFKSPITSIRLLLERITSGRQLSAAALLEYGETMQRETARLERLVNRLLEMHSIQSGEKRYRVARHRIGDLAAAAAVMNLDTHARAKRITVKLDIDDPEYEIDVDRTALEDSLENLLENAIKYSPPETFVSLTIRRKEREIGIFVRDEGIGIHPDDLAHIFEQFYRGQNGQTQSVAGTGLGLALVKAAVEGHGGTVRATSTLGQGSEFHISIPMRQEESYVPSVDRR
jgi:signal transduction histidine kinase